MAKLNLAPPLFSLLFLCVYCEKASAVVIANSSLPCTISCELGSNLQDYGFDANKNPITIDLKRCVKVYVNPSPSTTTCLSTTGSAAASCQRVCSPRSHELHTYSNRTGPFMIRTVRKCHAHSHHCRSCQRRPNRLFALPDSQYKTKIDVGKCSGVCSEDGSGEGLTTPTMATTPTSLSCQPTRTKTVSVEGPNGHVAIEVVENCSCVSSNCYRADHFQSVSVLHGNRRREEVVNTGKCVGSCHGVHINGRCLQHSLDGRCIWYLPGIQGKCRPTQGSVFSYTSTQRVNQTIPVVDECGCTTG